MSDRPPPMQYPRIVIDGDQIWLRCQVDGKEREVEISLGRAFDWLETLARALGKFVRR